MDEDDLYGDFGEDIAGQDVAVARVNGSMDAAPSSVIGGAKSNTGEALALREQLHTATEKLRLWQDAFAEVQGPAQGLGGPSDPRSLAKDLVRLRAFESKAREQLETLERREAALQVAVAERSLENVELRRRLATTSEACHGPLLQVNTLILDPAVAREFGDMRRALDERGEEIKRLKEELTAVQFSQESKAGRMLMAKCRALQEENEEMGKDLAEGKVSGLERQLAVAREYAAQLRRQFLELEEHVGALDQEAEQQQGQILMLQRQAQERQIISPSRGMGGSRGFGGGGFGRKGPPGPPGPGMDRKRRDQDMGGHGFERMKRMR